MSIYGHIFCTTSFTKEGICDISVFWNHIFAAISFNHLSCVKTQTTCSSRMHLHVIKTSSSANIFSNCQSYKIFFLKVSQTDNICSSFKPCVIISTFLMLWQVHALTVMFFPQSGWDCGFGEGGVCACLCCITKSYFFKYWVLWGW